MFPMTQKGEENSKNWRRTVGYVFFYIRLQVFPENFIHSENLFERNKEKKRKKYIYREAIP